MNISLVFRLHDVISELVQVRKFLFLNKKLEEKNCAVTFYEVPGFITVLKISVT